MGIAVSQLKPHQTERVETRWRRIVTPIPVPESLPIIERLRAAEPRSMSGMPPVLWDQAEGFLVRDRFGNQWIDLTSSIIVANSGHSHPRILEASSLVEEIRHDGGQAIAVQADVASRREVEAMLERAISELGEIDILVNNATIRAQC